MVAYDAFISYSHAKDKPIAGAIQSAVQKLGKPWYARRALRVFRDDASLSATPHLWPAIETALGASRFLILLASPDAAASPWVSKEVSWWLEHKGGATLLIALTDGELVWDGSIGDFRWSAETPLPPALRGGFGDEPRWVDLRKFRAGNARGPLFRELSADFAAAIHGRPKEDLLSQELREQRRALGLAWSAVAMLILLVALASWQWRVADRERVVAERNLDAAKQAINGLIGDISQGLSNVEGVRVSTLQKVLSRVDNTLTRVSRAANGDRDLERSRLRMYLSFSRLFDRAGDVDASLKSAGQALADARTLVKAEPAVAANQENFEYALQEMAEIKFRALDHEGALAASQELLAALQAKSRPPPVTLLRTYYDVGLNLRKLGQVDKSLTAFDSGLAAIQGQRNVAPADDVQRQLSSLHLERGRSLLAAQREVEAIQAFRAAIAATRPLLEKDGGDVYLQRDLALEQSSLASTLTKTGDSAGAAAAYSEALSLLRPMVKLDPDNVLAKSDMMSCLDGAAALKLQAGDAAGALTLFQEKEAMSKELQNDKPEADRWRVLH